MATKFLDQWYDPAAELPNVKKITIATVNSLIEQGVDRLKEAALLFDAIHSFPRRVCEPDGSKASDELLAQDKQIAKAMRNRMVTILESQYANTYPRYIEPGEIQDEIDAANHAERRSEAAHLDWEEWFITDYQPQIRLALTQIATAAIVSKDKNAVKLANKICAKLQSEIFQIHKILTKNGIDLPK